MMAIIGGIFTVFGIADGTVYSITKRLCKRSGLGGVTGEGKSNGSHHKIVGNGTAEMYERRVEGGGLVY
jgi:hypothetical protein